MSTLVIWALMIHHKEGYDLSIYSSEQKARDGLYDYVLAWWPKDENGKIIRKPKSPDKIIKKYFDTVENEYYDITSSTVK